MTLTEEQREAIRVISKLPMAIGCWKRSRREISGFQSWRGRYRSGTSS